MRAALALSHKRLTELKQEYAEKLALYWEAVAAIAEADIATTASGSGSGELLVRLDDLKERLFAPRLLALLNQTTRWWEREQSGAEDYRNTARAIIREAQTVAATPGGDKAGKPIATVLPKAMGEAEAYEVLGADPAVSGEELTRLCSRLLAAR